jgi:hypothetical protein
MDKLSKEENWKSFCTHHAVGDWHGMFLTYSSSGEVVQESRIIRSFYYIAEIDQILHHNHYIYTDGQSKSVVFKNLNRDSCKAIYLEGSFSWGSAEFIKGTPMGSEIGFRESDKRVSASFIYTGEGNLKEVYLIIEKLMGFETLDSWGMSKEGIWETRLKSSDGVVHNVNLNWERQVTQKYFDDIESPIESNEKILTISNNKIRLSCPRCISAEDSFTLGLEWSEPSFFLKGVRKYTDGCFEKFELTTFS